MPADAVIAKQVGLNVANLIASEGKDLEKWLAESGIAAEDTKSGSRRLDAERLRDILANHCAVMEGHLPNSCWPRKHRKLSERFPSVVCTCLEFLMHGECEHVVFVQALNNTALAGKLQKMPVIAKKGRKKRKREEPRAKAKPKSTRVPCMQENMFAHVCAQYK